MYKIIEPEVAGELGEGTDLDTNVHPPIIKRLHFKFSGWLGDDIIETFPCFLVTSSLKENIEINQLTGIVFENAQITKSDNFNIMYPTIELPKFFWAKIIGEYLQSDFSLGLDFRLVVSENAFKLLSKFKIQNALIEELTDKG